MDKEGAPSLRALPCLETFHSSLPSRDHRGNSSPLGSCNPGSNLSAVLLAPRLLPTSPPSIDLASGTTKKRQTHTETDMMGRLSKLFGERPSPSHPFKAGPPLSPRILPLLSLQHIHSIDVNASQLPRYVNFERNTDLVTGTLSPTPLLLESFTIRNDDDLTGKHLFLSLLNPKVFVFRPRDPATPPPLVPFGAPLPPKRGRPHSGGFGPDEPPYWGLRKIPLPVAQAISSWTALRRLEMKGAELVLTRRNAAGLLSTHFPLGAIEGGWVPPPEGEKLEIVFDYGGCGGRGFLEIDVEFDAFDEGGFVYLEHLRHQGYLEVLETGGESIKVTFILGTRRAKEELEKELRARWKGEGRDGKVLDNFEVVCVDT